MATTAPTKTESVWEVVVRPEGSPAQMQMRLLASIRPDLERRLQQDPQARAFNWHLPLYNVEVKHRSGSYRPGIPIKLTYKEEPGLLARGRAGAMAGADLPSVTLPDGRIQELGQRLVGVTDIRESILLDWSCRWNGLLDTWASATGTAIPTVVRSYCEHTTPLFLLAGDPGLGKTAVAEVVPDTYCRKYGLQGRLLMLNTDARGDGTVGNFGNRVRAAFATLASLPANELRVLVINEADALAMPRSEVHSHQEDRAATATFLQCLDALADEPLCAVFMTSNLLHSVDAAVRRRATSFEFRRPDREAREALLRQWLPDVDTRALGQAVKASYNMTPADIDRVMHQAYLAAIRQRTLLSPALVIACLRRAERTGRV